MLHKDVTQDMQNAPKFNLPTDYNKRYTIRFLMDLKHLQDRTPLSAMAKALAERIDLSKRQFYNYVEQHIESEKKPLHENQLAAIADYFNISAEQLLTVNVRENSQNQTSEGSPCPECSAE